MTLRRSVLLAAGEDEQHLEQMIRTSNADLVCLDLEDTVAPSRKKQARERVARLLTKDIWGRSGRAFRINAFDTPYAHDDLVEVLTAARGNVDVILLSKVESEREVWWADQLITRLAGEHGFATDIKLCAGIESARALTDIDRIAASSRRLEMLGFAIGDLSISLGVRIGPYLQDRSLYPGDLNHFIRARINLAAKTHGLQSLDGPWPNINDHATLAEDARWGAMLGMDGKLALAVDQVRVIHEAYRPSAAEVTWSERMLELYRKSVEAGEGSGVSDGQFFDPVTVGLAQATLTRAAAPL
ncbi:MAG: CoA ester lyase [Pseudomonadota bacterium]